MTPNEQLLVLPLPQPGPAPPRRGSQPAALPPHSPPGGRAWPGRAGAVWHWQPLSLANWDLLSLLRNVKIYLGDSAHLGNHSTESGPAGPAWPQASRIRVYRDRVSLTRR